MKTALTIILGISIMACQPNKNAQTIIDTAIEAHGGGLFETANVSFTFRNKDYSVTHQGEKVTYTRSFSDDSLGAFKDVLVNSTDFVRYINDEKVEIAEKKEKAYANSVNSVLYFFQLPYGLNDAAVVKKYMGQAIIKDQLYDKVRVTFGQEGGGEDFDDIFIYWINTKTNIMDYMAYSYKTSGGGMRFRQAINPRTIGGLRVQDYVNFKPEKKNAKVEELDEAFNSGALIELSQIINENVIVN